MLEPNRADAARDDCSVCRGDHLHDDPHQPEFEERAIVDFEQPVGDVNPVVGVYADQMGVEGRVMEFSQRRAIRDRSVAQAARRHP